MKRLLLLLFSLFVSVAGSLAQTYSFTDSWGKEGFTLTSQDQQGISLNYSIRQFVMDDIDVRGEAMKHISLKDCFLPADEGTPDLPGNGWYIAIPQGATPVLKITSTRKEIYRDVDIAPAPRIPADIDNTPPQYIKNERIYSNNALFPSEPIKISELKKIRGVDAVMLGITPFQYNPITRELVVYRDLKIEVQFRGGNGQFGDERLRSRWWDPILQDIFVNAAELPEVDYSSRIGKHTRATGCEYLIICPDGAEFQQWADTIRAFRTEQGILTEVYPISEVGGNSAFSIETFINDAYNNWDIPPAACLLLGDYGSNGENSIISNVLNDHPDGYNPYISDNLFADIDNDLLPDIVFARITARNSSELSLMINKFLKYERTPPTSPDFYNHPITALGWQTERWFQICSEAVGGYLKNVQGKEPVRINEVYGGNPDTDPWSTAINTETILDVFCPGGLGYMPETPGELGDWTGGTATAINNAINSGSFLLQHRDHGYEAGWGEPSYSSSNISGLNNTDLTFVMSINCQTGKFDADNECFAEIFHRYQYNGQGSGALGILAPTEVSYSFVNDTYVWGLYDHMFPDFFPQYGSNPASRGMLPAFGNAAGKYFLYSSSWPYNDQHKEITFKIFHAHGDAFTCLYSEVPQNLTVLHNDVQLAGLTTFNVQANEGALIALSVNGELIGVATGTGAPLDIEIIPQNPPHNLDVVVTKGNYYRYHAQVPIIPPNGPFVVTESFAVNDLLGNNNGQLDYGETVNLDVTLKNLGTENAENVIVTITSADEFVTIVDNTAEAGTIAPNQSATVNSAFSITASGNVPNGHIIPFAMEATNGDTIWNSTFSVKAYAAILEYLEFTLADPAGNNDGRLDPGETANLTVTVKNKGAADAYNVYGILSTTDDFVEVIADSSMFGDIAQNVTGSMTFQVTAKVVTPPGHLAEFNVDIIGDLGITTSGSLDFTVGRFPVLVLDLDNNHNSGTIMRDAIDDWRIFAEYATTIPEDLSHYRTIFVCLGTYNTNHVLTTEEADPFVDFLNAGGNMYMEGADTWAYDQQYNSTQLHPMFKIEGLVDGGDDLSTVQGLTGTFVEGYTFYFNGDNKYIDRISPISPAYTIFNNLAPAYNVAVAYNSGTYKTIGSVFEFGGLLDNELYNKKQLMLKYLNFLDMEPITEIPPVPEGETTVCGTENPCCYTTHPIPDAEYYLWEIEPSEAGTIDGWDTTVTVHWTPGFRGTASVKVCGMNQLGTGPVSDALTVTVNDLPDATMTFSTTTICNGETSNLDIDLTGVSPWHVVISFGGYEITFDPDKPQVYGIPVNPVTDLDVTILSLSDGTGCENTDFETTTITVLQLPGTPAKPSGPEYVDLYTTTQSAYQTTGAGNVTSYAWSLEPPSSGNLVPGGTGLDCTVEWATGFTGAATIKVKGSNQCGESAFSQALAVNVANTFGVEENNSGLGISVYPNPNSGSFKIELRASEPTHAVFQILNAAGESVQKTLELSVDKSMNLPVNMENLTEGIYLLKFETEKGISTRKVLIRK